MNCPRCGVANPDAKNYCGDCGTPLDPNLAYLETFIKTEVRQSLDARFKDQKFLEIETSLAVVERVKGWATLFLYFLAIPLAILALVLATLGIKEYRDFKGLIRDAENQVKPRLEAAKASADTAKQQADEAQKEAADAKKVIQSASGVVTDVRNLSAQFSKLENQTSLLLKNATSNVDKQVSELNGKIEVAMKDIAEQQRKLASTNELVKSIFEKGTTEYFDTKNQGSRFAYVPVKVGPKGEEKSGAMIFMLMATIPIRQTIELKFHIFSQPKGSFFPIAKNVLAFNWADSTDTLKQFPLELTYIPDPTASEAPLFKALYVRDRRVYADETLIMDLQPIPEK
jgi:hypothetical protein